MDKYFQEEENQMVTFMKDFFKNLNEKVDKDRKEQDFINLCVCDWGATLKDKVESQKEEINYLKGIVQNINLAREKDDRDVQDMLTKLNKRERKLEDELEAKDNEIAELKAQLKKQSGSVKAKKNKEEVDPELEEAMHGKYRLLNRDLDKLPKGVTV